MPGKALAYFSIVTAKALSEFVPVIPAPDQFRELAGKKKEQADRIEKVVEESDHRRTRVSAAMEARCRNKTSVAPYRRARTISHNGAAGIFSDGRFSRTKIPVGSSISASSLLSSNSSVKWSPDFVFS